MLPTITEKYPPVALKELITELSKFPTAPLAAQQALIARLVKCHPTLHYHWGGNACYWRARKLPDDLATKVDDLIWRKGTPARLGRANPEGFPVLYLARSRDTTFREVDAENDKVVVTQFEILRGSGIQVAPIGELMHIARTGQGFFAGSLVAQLTKFMKACKPDDLRSLLITDSFLFGCLTNREGDYLKSSWVAKCLFDKLDLVVAVAYPSLRQVGGVNLAVRVENFWNRWGIRSVSSGRAVHLAEGYYQLTEVSQVREIRLGGELVWDGTVVDDDTSLSLTSPWSEK